MGFPILAVVLAWSWKRVSVEDGATWRVSGVGGTLYWLTLAVVLTLGTFSFVLWIVLIPAAIAMTVFAKSVEPTRAWLLPVVFGAAPAAWIASGAIDVDGAWFALCVGFAVLGVVTGALFESRAYQRRKRAESSERLIRQS